MITATRPLTSNSLSISNSSFVAIVTISLSTRWCVLKCFVWEKGLLYMMTSFARIRLGSGDKFANFGEFFLNAVPIQTLSYHLATWWMTPGFRKLKPYRLDEEYRNSWEMGEEPRSTEVRWKKQLNCLLYSDIPTQCMWDHINSSTVNTALISNVTFWNPISALRSRKHCRHIIKPYFRINPCLWAHTRLIISESNA